MNFSIVVPGGCNAKCKFCFWEQTKECDNYIKKLDSVLNNLPEELALSLTGGEPTLSPYFSDILTTIKKYKNKFEKVILTTNGSFLHKYLDIIDGVVDHLNISRHHYDEKIVSEIFGDDISPDFYLKPLISNINRIGIDVTFNAVLAGHLNDKQDVLDFIQYAKNMGVSAVCFRKEYCNDVTLDATNLEEYFKDYKSTYEYSCPVCRTKVQIINGMKVSWKTSSFEPSVELKDVYELILQPNGKLTADWAGEKVVQIYNGIIINNLNFVNVQQKPKKQTTNPKVINTSNYDGCGVTLKTSSYNGRGGVSISSYSGCGSSGYSGRC